MGQNRTTLHEANIESAMYYALVTFVHLEDHIDFLPADNQNNPADQARKYEEPRLVRGVLPSRYHLDEVLRTLSLQDRPKNR